MYTEYHPLIMADETTKRDSQVSSPEKNSPIIHDDDPLSKHENTGALHHIITHHDPNWDGGDVDFSNVNENKTLRKMDWRLLPILGLLIY